MMKFSNTVPMKTQLLENYASEEQDIRFTKVKIWLMHLGLNHNGSVFTKEVVQKAIPSLANTPIMGSVSLNNWDVKDFEGHESDIEITENGELRFVNKTVPFGVIPEFNNAKFETRIGDDMIEREYLTVEGVLWNKWNDAIDILYGKHGVTGQSMELSDDFKGIYNGETFEFTEFQFYGACLLGDEVDPAMHNSTVELKYSINTKDIINEKLELFEKLTFSSDKGGHNVSEEKLDFAETTEEEVKDAPVVEDKEVVEEPKKKVTRKKTTVKKEEPKEEVQEEVQEIAPPTESITAQEETIEQIAEGREELRKEQEELPSPASRVKVIDNEYSISELEDIVRDYEKVKTDFDNLKKEVHSEKASSLITEHSKNLEPEEIETLQEFAKTNSIEALETQIFAAIGRKNFSKVSVKEVEDKIEVKPSQVKFSILEEKAPANSLEEALKNL